MVWPLIGGLVGAGASLFGAKKAADGADADRALQQWAMQNMANTEFQPWHARTAGGAGVQFGPHGATSLNLGEFGNPYSQLGGLASQGFGGAQNLQGQANNNLFMMGNNEARANLLAGGAYNSAMNPQSSGLVNPFANAARGMLGTANDFIGGARGFMGEAQQGFGDIADQQLATMRQAAAPYESRALADLEDKLFAQGRLDSTGGDRAYQAFAKGLGEADLSRQLAATGEARAVRGQAGQLGQVFGGLGQGFGQLGQGYGDTAFRGMGIEDNLLNSAFNRFGATSGLAADLNQNQFNRGGALFNQGLSALGGQSGILENILGLGRFGANLGAQAASTDISKYGGAGNIANQMGPSGSDIWGAALAKGGGNLFESFGGWENIGSGLGDIWGKMTGKTGAGISSGRVA